MTRELARNEDRPALLRMRPQDITINDVIAIAVADAERRLHQTGKERTAEANQLEREADELQSAVRREAKEAAEAQKRPVYEQLLGPLRQLGCQGKLTVDTQKRWVDSTHVEYIRVTIELVNTGRGSLSIVSEHDYTPEQRQRLERADRLLADAAVERAAAVAARRNAANVGTIERQMRAKVATKALQTTEGGQELLQLLLGDVEQQIAALPGV